MLVVCLINKVLNDAFSLFCYLLHSWAQFQFQFRVLFIYFSFMFYDLFNFLIFIFNFLSNSPNHVKSAACRCVRPCATAPLVSSCRTEYIFIDHFVHLLNLPLNIYSLCFFFLVFPNAWTLDWYDSLFLCLKFSLSCLYANLVNAFNHFHAWF